MIDPDALVAWDAEDDPQGNIRQIADNGVSVEEVEEILFDPDSTASFSRTSGRPTLRGSTSTGRFILVIYEIEARKPFTVRPITAYEIDEG
jgi:hypothetical protein